MIKALALVLGLLSLNLQAHTMTGAGKDKDVALSSVYYKLITLGNLSDKPRQYQIEVNGKPTPLRVSLQPKQYKKFRLPLHITKPDTVEKFRICSISNRLAGEQYNTSVCLSQRLYYPLLQMQKLQQ